MMIRVLLALALLVLPDVAHADWYEASSRHFVVYSDDKPDRLKAFATNLERFDKTMHVIRNTPDDPVGDANRVTVYVVDDTSRVAKLVGDSGVAGFYSPRAGGSVAFVPRDSGDGGKEDLGPLAILLHEYSHHFLLSVSPNAAYPGWFVEGFAEFYATTTFDKDGAVSIGLPPQYRAYGLMSGNMLPIEKLLTSDTRKLDSIERDALYGRGWLLTHYFLMSGKRTGQLPAYLEALNSGKPPLEAARVFGDLKLLDREIETYKRGKIAGWRIPASNLAIEPVTLRKLTPGEDATMDVRIRSKAGVNTKTAPAVYAAAQKACAPFPNDRGAQLVLAEAAYDADDYPAAEAAAERAFAADPKSVDALLYQARAKMALARKAKDTSPATWAAIRKLIGSANRLDTENPQPLVLFYESYAMNGQPPPRIARDGLYYAYVLAPQDRGLRFEAATAYLQDGKVPQARELLLALAYDPHERGMATIASQLIGEIDAGHADTALEHLEKQEDGKDSDKLAPPAPEPGGKTGG